jgi:glycosyltransferase involved in cell wall biosynthesis
MPTVTVVVPVYNAAEFIAEAIDSALAQTYRDAEVIVVDDGSTDATPAILAGYGDRIRAIGRPKIGLPAARNTAIAAARGSLIALLDGDDFWEPAFLERMVATLSAHGPEVVGACAGSVQIDRAGRVLDNSTYLPPPAFGLRDLVPSNAIVVSATVLRRDALLATGSFDEQMDACEDWELWLRLALEGGSYVGVRERLCRSRRHGSNLSNDIVRMHGGAVCVLDKLFAHPALPADLLARRTAITGAVLSHTSWHWYRLGRDHEGAEALRVAAEVWPEILLDDDTLYAIIAGPQPLAQRGTVHGIDLDRGAERIAQALAACGGSGAPADATLLRRARGRAGRALAQLAYGQRRMAMARRFALDALRADPTLLTDRKVAGPLVKSFAGTRVIDALSRWRRGPLPALPHGQKWPRGRED